MTLEQVIENAVADAISKQLQPLIEPLIGKLNFPDRGIDDDFLTTPEVAKLLKVSPITVSLWRHQKKGPDYVVFGAGRGVRYKRSVVIAFLERNRPLLGKRGRPSKRDMTVVATSGVTTGLVKKARAAQAEK